MKKTLFFALISGLILIGCTPAVRAANNEPQTKNVETIKKTDSTGMYKPGQVIVPWTRGTFRARDPLPFNTIDLEYMIQIPEEGMEIPRTGNSVSMGLWKPYHIVNEDSQKFKVWNRVFYIRDPNNPEAHAILTVSEANTFQRIVPRNVMPMTDFYLLTKTLDWDHLFAQFNDIVYEILYMNPTRAELQRELVE